MNGTYTWDRLRSDGDGFTTCYVWKIPLSPRFIPKGVAEASQISLRDAHIIPNYSAIRNTADVTGGKPIAIWPQSISGVSAINALVAFYNIHGRKREVLFFYFIPDFPRRVDGRPAAGRKIIAESLSQHDENMLYRPPLSGKRNKTPQETYIYGFWCTNYFDLSRCSIKVAIYPWMGG
jgi:hypothetical protein